MRNVALVLACPQVGKHLRALRSRRPTDDCIYSAPGVETQARGGSTHLPLSAGKQLLDLVLGVDKFGL